METITVSHSFVEGDVVRYDQSTFAWTKSQANTAENSEVAGVVSAKTATSFDVTYSGYISIPSLAGVTSPVLFLDSSAAGGLTASPPSAIGTVVKPVLTKTSNGSGYVVSNYLGTQIGGSSTVAIDEIQPVGTIMPFAGSTIPDSWLACDGNSYAVSAYPNLYAKLQNSSGDRAPAYGYVVEIGVNTTTYPTWFSAVAVGDTILYSPTQADLTVTLPTIVTTYSLIGRVIAKGTASVTVQVFPKYDSTTKNFVVPNVIPSTVGWVAAFLPVTNSTIYDNLNSNQRRANAAGQPTAAVSTVSVTHFNTPDLRGRFAIGTNTSALGELEGDGANYSAISGIYSIGSEGGQEFVVATPVAIKSAATGTDVNVINNIGASSNIANIPPYTVVRYIIKATPYTRAAIIDGLDLPYTSLLVGDLRDGSLRPGGSGEDLIFKTNDGTSGVERMRLTNKGVLTLTQAAGYSSGIYMIGAATDTMPSVKFYNPDTTTNKYTWWAARDGHAFSVESNSVDGNSGTYRFMVSENGNVSIGAQAYPLAALDINGSSGGGNQIWIRPGSGGGIVGATVGLKLEYSASGDVANIQAYDYTGAGTGKNLVLNGQGANVGIGAVSNAPVSTLHIYKNTIENSAGGLTGSLAKAGIVLESTLSGLGTGVTYGPGLFWKTTTNATLPMAGIFVGGRGSGTCINLATSTAYASGINKIVMTLHDGKVGIGTTGPSVALDIVGEARASIGTTGGSNAKALTTKDYVDGVGFGSAAQSWQSFATTGTNIRVVGTEYTNSTGKPIMVVVTRPDTGSSPAAGFQINGVTLAYATYDSGGNFGSSILSFIVPTAATYKVVGYASYTYWSELR